MSDTSVLGSNGSLQHHFFSDVYFNCRFVKDFSLPQTIERVANLDEDIDASKCSNVYASKNFTVNIVFPYVICFML